jgi:hypothetical protein
MNSAHLDAFGLHLFRMAVGAPVRLRGGAVQRSAAADRAYWHDPRNKGLRAFYRRIAREAVLYLRDPESAQP